jgi:AraC-like DNA-binding protein
MAADFQKIFETIDARLISNQSITPKKLARELNLTVQDIETAIREAENVAFSEYKRYRRLAYALKILHVPKASDSVGDLRERRSLPRYTIPHTTVRYHLYARGITRSRFSRRCPVKDLNQVGMSFLADRYLKPERPVSLLVASPGRKDAVRLEGRVVYASSVNVERYRYCIGIQFAPFDAKINNNTPDDLKAVAELEQSVGLLKPQKPRAANPEHAR